MALALTRRLSLLFVGALQIPLILACLPVNAASALAAWALGSDGVLLLRTSRGARLEAFFQSADSGKGARVWIDFPGELSRTRTLRGSGPVRAIRLGKPTPGSTRLVIEFEPSVDLDPAQLKLVGTSPERWKLSFEGLPTRGLRRIGEGDLSSSPSSRWPPGVSITPTRTPISASGLPEVPRPAAAAQ